MEKSELSLQVPRRAHVSLFETDQSLLHSLVHLSHSNFEWSRGEVPDLLPLFYIHRLLLRRPRQNDVGFYILRGFGVAQTFF